ncbi:MAG: hypothetical protein AB8B86_07815 [Pseudomonadales bacterium]
MTQSLLRRLGVRDQDLSSLSMCKADKKSLQEWLGGLPSANIGETSKQLYAVSEEMLRLKIAPELRLGLLDALLPAIEDNLNLLSVHYQHKQALLPKKSQQVVDLSHALRMCVANCYTIAAVELANSKSGLLRRPNKSLTCAAIAGAMKLLKDDLLLSYQLYSTAPRTLWLKMHELYAISCELENHSLPIEGKKNDTKIVRNLYVETVLLGSIKANQLRQDDLARVVDLIPEWLDKVSIDDYKDGEIPALFMIDGSSDRGPVYSHLLSEPALAKCSLQLSTGELVQEIRRIVDDSKSGKISIGEQKVRIDLLNHLILAWGKCTKRSFMRIDSEEELDICVGLDSAHTFAAGDNTLETMRAQASSALALEVAFEQFHSYDNLKTNDSPGILPKADITLQENDEGIECIDYSSSLPGQAAEQELAVTTPLSVRVGVNNASPGGYSLSLPDTDNLRIHAGDLLGVKDAATELWSVAAIRWLHRPSRTELTFGVELLSPAYMPSIARNIETGSEPSEYFPVLLLPEVSVTEQSASLLVSDVNIKIGDTMQVLDRDQVRIVRIMEQLAKTRVYAQYSYENFDAANDGGEAAEDLFDALWGNL